MNSIVYRYFKEVELPCCSSCDERSSGGWCFTSWGWRWYLEMMIFGLEKVQENFLTCSFERFTIENGKYGCTSVFSSGFYLCTQIELIPCEIVGSSTKFQKSYRVLTSRDKLSRFCFVLYFHKENWHLKRVEDLF